MEDKNNINKSKSLTKEEEDILIESIKYLQEEYNIKLEKLKLLRQ